MVPIEATVIPLPTELTTPPVTKMYFDMGKPNLGIQQKQSRQEVGVS
jgi:hypothetical protein